MQETIRRQAGIILNLDSIAEFRILSNNVDAAIGSTKHLIEPSIELTGSPESVP